jgi:hypothetical protein
LNIFDIVHIVGGGVFWLMKENIGGCILAVMLSIAFFGFALPRMGRNRLDFCLIGRKIPD